MATAARGGGLGLAGMLCSRVLSLLLQASIARLFGIPFFGYYITGIMLCRFLQIFAGLGLPIGSIRFMVQAITHKNRKAMFLVYRTSIVTPLLTGTILGFLFYFATPALCNNIFNEPNLIPVLQLFAFAVPWFALLRTLAELSRSFGTVRYTVLVVDILFPLIQICILLYAFIFDIAPLVAIVSFLSATIICASLMGLIVYRQIRHQIFSKADESEEQALFSVRELLGYSIPLMPTGLFFTVSNNIDIFMLNIFTSGGAVGIYAAATRWTLLVDSIGVPIHAIFRPLLAKAITTNNIQLLRSLFMASSRWVLYLTLPFFTCMMVASQPAMYFFLQEDTQGIASILLWILLIARITNPFGNGAGLILSMGGHQYRELSSLACGSVINILLNVLLIPRYGVIGAAVATGIGFYSSNLLRITFVQQRWHMVPWSKRMFIPGAAVCVILLIRLLLGPDVSMILQVTGGGIAAFFILCTILISGFEQDDKNIVPLLPQTVQNIIDKIRISAIINTFFKN